MARIYISIGSNIDPERNVREGVQALKDEFVCLQLSSVYESAAVGFEGENFLNLVAGAETDAGIEAVVASLRCIEDRFGRDRSGPRFSFRCLDLDLLLYDDQILKKGGIDVPREEITQNAFVLLPLSEIGPTLIHPLLNVSMQQLWADFDKESQALHVIPFEW